MLPALISIVLSGCISGGHWLSQCLPETSPDLIGSFVHVRLPDAQDAVTATRQVAVLGSVPDHLSFLFWRESRKASTISVPVTAVELNDKAKRGDKGIDAPLIEQYVLANVDDALLVEKGVAGRFKLGFLLSLNNAKNLCNAFWACEGTCARTIDNSVATMTRTRSYSALIQPKHCLAELANETRLVSPLPYARACMGTEECFMSGRAPWLYIGGLPACCAWKIAPGFESRLPTSSLGNLYRARVRAVHLFRGRDHGSPTLSAAETCSCSQFASQIGIAFPRAALPRRPSTDRGIGPKNSTATDAGLVACARRESATTLLGAKNWIAFQVASERNAARFAVSNGTWHDSFNSPENYPLGRARDGRGSYSSAVSVLFSRFYQDLPHRGKAMEKC